MNRKTPLALTAVLLLAACGGGAAPAAPASSAAAVSKPAASPSQAAPGSAAAKPSGSAAPASAAAKPSGSAAAKPAASGAAGFQAQWDALVAAAKQEGKLSIGFSPNPPFEQQVLPAFQKEFGIQFEHPAGSATALATKLVQEKAAGIHSVDVFIASCNAAATIAYPAKLYAPLKDQLIVPDVNDPSKWVGGKVSYMDNEQTYILRLDRQVRYFFHVNPQAVDLSKLQQPQDLLNPQWKGKIGSIDVTGLSGQSEAAIFLKLKGADFVKQLYLGQQVAYTAEQRVLADWIAKNQYPIGIALPVDEYVSAKSAGLPVARVTKLGDLTAQLTAVMLAGIMDGAQHPNAAKLFVNWLLTQEGQQALADSLQSGVIRTDVNYSKVSPDDVPSASAGNYFDDCTMDYNTTERVQLNDQLKTILGR